ncbi:hypothetical protein MPH47_17220 [Psychrobacillus psychrodurans]|uniref:hypothetical protein n=1 Tax=Psychrobacillus psychrodurans TaxID=126157 RepID=UPI001F4D3A52|nr:hypothetical protein [Psychrobacillus psychrodurans]MCK1998940.1 hypothetical protein [Psychrobacillus psychrodurans]
MSYPVNRRVVSFKGDTFIVDLWLVDNKYNAFAQQIYVDDYRVGHSEGLPTESIEEFTVISEIQKKYK